LTETPSEQIPELSAHTPKKRDFSHPYLHNMTRHNGREVNPSARIDELLVDKGADEDAQSILHDTAVSDPHPAPFESAVLSGWTAPSSR